MIIEKLSSLTIKVTLSRSEMSEHKISFDSLDENNCNSRILIRYIINEIHVNLGLNLYKEKLYIEAFSIKSGCILYISVSSPLTNIQPVPDNAGTEFVIFETSDEKRLIRFSDEILNYFENSVIMSSLHHSGNIFRLIVTLDKNDENYVKKTADMHGLKSFTGLKIKTATNEYFKCIFEKNAAEKLAGKELF